jgi:hypothetical protein
LFDIFQTNDSKLFIPFLQDIIEAMEARHSVTPNLWQLWSSPFIQALLAVLDVRLTQLHQTSCFAILWAPSWLLWEKNVAPLHAVYPAFNSPLQSVVPLFEMAISDKDAHFDLNDIILVTNHYEHSSLHGVGQDELEVVATVGLLSRIDYPGSYRINKIKVLVAYGSVFLKLLQHSRIPPISALPVLCRALCKWPYIHGNAPRWRVTIHILLRDFVAAEYHDEAYNLNTASRPRTFLQALTDIQSLGSSGSDEGKASDIRIAISWLSFLPNANEIARQILLNNSLKEFGEHVAKRSSPPFMCLYKQSSLFPWTYALIVPQARGQVYEYCRDTNEVKWILNEIDPSFNLPVDEGGYNYTHERRAWEIMKEEYDKIQAEQAVGTKRIPDQANGISDIVALSDIGGREDRRASASTSLLEGMADNNGLIADSPGGSPAVIVEIPDLESVMMPEASMMSGRSQVDQGLDLEKGLAETEGD